MEVVVPRVHGLKPETETVDGGRRVEFFAEDASTAIRPLGADGRKPQSSQPHAPDRRPAFSLAVQWSGCGADCRPYASLTQRPPGPEIDRSRSWPRWRLRPGDKKGLPTACQPRPIHRRASIR